MSLIVTDTAYFQNYAKFRQRVGIAKT